MVDSKYYRKRVTGDIALFLLAVVPAFLAFYTDINQISEDLFLRMGAIMVLFAAFLEFRTHEIQIQKQEDKYKAIWKALGQVAEGLAQVDKTAKISLRNQAYFIQSAGLDPAMGKPEDIKDMIITEGIKALRDLKPMSASYYKYNSIVSYLGKLLVFLGTLIWAFGDFGLKLVSDYL